MTTDTFYFPTVAVLDLEGTWHKRNTTDAYIDPRAVGQFAWFDCDDAETPIHSIEATSTAADLSMNADKCTACFPAGKMAGAHL